MVVIIPSLICFIINIIIFKYVRSSTNRVQSSTAIRKNNQHQAINRRDLHLLRHMINMFCIFVGGWSPVYLYTIIISQNPNYIILLICEILAELSLLSIIMNLFLYNHELRGYLLQKISRV
jgi:ABC-type polysaccharide/polyol phosphate export permease